MRRIVRAAAFVAGALLVAATVRAEITPEAKPVVDRWIEASGGREAFFADTALHVKGRSVSGGSPGTFEYWTQGAQRLLEHTTDGPVRFRCGYDGVAGWRTDRTLRQIAPLEGKDLEAIRSDAWFLSEQWARDDQGGGTVRRGMPAYSRGRAMLGLEVTPPVGPPKTLWFDDATGLLCRITHVRDQYRWDEWYSGWKSIAGRQRWTVATVGDSLLHAPSFQRRRADTIRVEVPRDLAAFSPPESRVRQLTWLKTRGVARLPFRYRRGHVWVRASLNGAEPADFILDTGCTSTAVDAEHARKIGLATEGRLLAQGVGGTGRGGWAAVKSLRLSGPNGDGVSVPDLKVGVLAINDDMTVLDWRDAAGLIGYDVLSRFVVEVDFDRQEVTLHDPKTYQYTGGGFAVPFTLYSCIPTVEVTLNAGCTGRFIVDLGNASVMSVHTEQVDACHLFGGKRKEIQHWVGGIGGSIPETVCRLDSIQIGPFRWNDPVTGMSLHHLGHAGSKDVQGNLGTSVLDRFRCTFDYARSQLWLEPGQRFSRRDGYSHSGIYLERWSGRVWIAGVVRHSPAAEAGLKVRDVLKAVDGRPIERWTPEALEALFDEGPVGSKVRLTIERELVDQEFELMLAEVL